VTDEAVQADKRRYRRTLLIFALVGPYIGLAVALVLMTGFSLVQGMGPAATLAAVFALGIVSAVFAIPVGGLPGLLAGFAAVALQRRGVRGPRYYAQCAAISGLATLIIPLVLRHGYEIWGAVGVVTGLICAHLTVRR
jgi:hypothetical protein